MKKSRQDIESELRLLVPKAPSDRMLDGIAGELAPTRATARGGNAWTWSAVALALAASIAIAVSFWPQPGEVLGPALTIVDRQPQGPTEMPPPTMLAYQHVWGQSPDALNELLDRHAASLFAAGSPSDDVGSLYRDLMTN